MTDYVEREYRAALSAALTLRRLSAGYAVWAREGGKDTVRNIREAKRLRTEARWYLDLARRRRLVIIARQLRDMREAA